MLPLYTDECVDFRIVRGLRERGVAIVTVQELGLLGAPDDVHLAQAIALNRVVLSADADFLRLANEMLESEQLFPGLIFVRSGLAVGTAISRILEIATILESHEMVNRIEWV